MNYRRIRKTISIGDTVPVVIDGALHDLPIVNVPDGYQRRWLQRRYPRLVTVRLPDGHYMDCRYMPVSHQF